MNYRSVSALNRDILNWLIRLPRDLELIVGVPRSGLLAANLLSVHLDLPLTDVDGLLAGKVFASGLRYKGNNPADLLSTRRKILVVDDSVHCGASMRAVRERITAANLPHEILYGAVYITPGQKRVVDFFGEVLPQLRIFEWNLTNNVCLRNSCMDVDGVLCRDPTDKENDDGPVYTDFIQSVESLMVPRETIGCLVTCRLEKYRALTEEWLARQGIKYRDLVMMDFPDKAARLAAGLHSSFKATVYKDKGAVLFIESSLVQATEIAKLSGKDVLCMETREMVRPGHTIRLHRAAQNLTARLREDPVGVLIDGGIAAANNANSLGKRILSKAKRTIKQLFNW